MATTPQPPEGASTPPPTPAATPAHLPPAAAHTKLTHEVRFVSYPKLLFIWPVVLAGFIFWPIGKDVRPAAATPAEGQAAAAPAPATGAAPGVQPVTPAANPTRLGWLGWIYIWILVLVLLALGVDLDRNMAAFWVLLVVAIWLLGMWLHDAKGFTFFGDIYNWFASLHVQYDRNLALALSIVLLVPYLIMIAWGRFNDRWRITHNEFEHYVFGKMDDSLGRGAKTVRTMYPDMFELLLGLAGTLIVYNASGTKELRRIPNVMFLPFIRARLNNILATTAITVDQTEEEEDDENA